MGVLACFKKFLVSKKFLPGEDIKIFSQGVARLPVDIFMSHSTKLFVGEPFNVSEKSGYRKTLFIKGRCHDLPSKFFNITVPKNFVPETFVFQKMSGTDKI